MPKISLVTMSGLVDTTSTQPGLSPHRPLLGMENVVIKLLLGDVDGKALEYVMSPPLRPLDIPGFPASYDEVGDYERLLLGKLSSPTLPVIALHGAIGSGKTTTLDWIRRALASFTCPQCTQDHYIGGCTKLITYVDFAKHPDLRGGVDKHAVCSLVASEMMARLGLVLDESQIYIDMLEQLCREYDTNREGELSTAAAPLLSRAAWLRKSAGLDHLDRRRGLVLEQALPRA